MLIMQQMDVTSPTRGIIAHGCNAVHVMGAGVALAIARKFPQAYNAYKNLHVRNGQLVECPHLLGTVQFVDIDYNLFIANCFTQIKTGRDEHGNPPAYLEAIEQCLTQCLVHAQTHGVPLYAPQIGCGLGGLDWETQVKPIYTKLAEEFPEVMFYVCTI